MTATPEQFRQWDNDHVWHPFTPMQAYREEQAPIIARAEGFSLFDVDGREYLDGISSLWCNVHGHRVPAIDQAIRDQLDRVGHSTLLGLSSTPSIELARRLVEITPSGLNKVFYSDSGSTAVEAALKLAFQYHQQRGEQATTRRLFATVSGAYHGDTIGSVSVGSIELFHRVYGQLLFETVSVPSPCCYPTPADVTSEEHQQHCFDAVEKLFETSGHELAAFVIEPLVQGAAGILVHPEGYLRHVRKLTRDYGVPLIADEVAVGFGRTGTMFACEQEDVQPDLMCVAKGLTGGYLPVAATLTSDEIYDAFLGDPAAGRTFFHGHTFTGNPLGCAAALASLSLIEEYDVLGNARAIAQEMTHQLSVLKDDPHVGQIRQKGTMIGIELVQSREPFIPYPADDRIGHQVTVAARRHGLIIRPLGSVIVLMPAPAMPLPLVQQLSELTVKAIKEVTAGDAG